MRLDGVGIFVQSMKEMVDFYRDVLEFEIEWNGKDPSVLLKKDDTLFMFYGRNDFEKMTSRKYQYTSGINGHFEIALSAKNYADVDAMYQKVISKGARSIMEPELESWGQRTCYIADPEGNLIEIGSFVKE